MISRHLSPVIALLIPLTVAAAQPLSISADDLTITAAWAHATPAGADAGAVYFTIENGGRQLETLLRASTPAASEAVFARTTEHDGQSHVEQIWTIDVVAGRTVTFRPGGRHVMLKGLTQPLVAGAQFPLTLQFQHAGQVTLHVRIVPIGSSGPSPPATGGLRGGTQPVAAAIPGHEPDARMLFRPAVISSTVAS
jgi:copper(I)-binding protein